MAMKDNIAQLAPLLQRNTADPRPVVSMLCGISGSGKSTIAQAVVSAFTSFERLSIDGIIHEEHGLYSIDYPATKYDEYQHEADRAFEGRLEVLLEQGARNIVLDRSFYAQEDRRQFTELVRKRGGRTVLVYLKPKSKAVIWKRICDRRTKPKTADSAFEVTTEILDHRWEGFEAPQGEGEIVIDVT